MTTARFSEELRSRYCQEPTMWDTSSSTFAGTPTLESKNGNAIAEATVNNDKNEDHFEKLTIAGGTFTGAANQAAIATYFAKPGDITITAGTFSSDIRKIFPAYPEAFGDIEIAENNGKFYVVIHSESISLPATKEMTVGTSERLEVTFTPENTTETTLTWSNRYTYRINRDCGR